VFVNTMASYRRAQDGFDAMLAAVPDSGWDRPSACSAWTVRDVAGHVIWGQEQVRCWAMGLELDRMAGAPGAPHPGEMAGTEPVATWRAVRAAAVDALTDEALHRTVSLPGLGARPIAAVVTMLVTDHLAHSWDIGHALNLAVPLDAELIPGSFAWARDNIVRVPGLFGPEVTPPPDADEQTRWLAFLGRAAWRPVSV